MARRNRVVLAALLAVGVVVLVTLAVALGGNRDGTGSTVSTVSQRRPVAPDGGSSVPPGGGQPPAETAPSTGGPANSGEAAVVKDNSIQMGLISREYLTVVPAKIAQGESLPIVVVLHGLGVDRTQMLNTADWRGAVGRDRFIAVFPQGFANSWNIGPCCPPSNLLGVDDMGFIDQVLAQVKALPQANPERVYITGFSAGGIMAYAVVCGRPGVYSALAPIGGSNILRCKPSRPVSLLHQHSDPDPVVPFNGGLGLGQIVSSAALPSVPETVAEWAMADGCATGVVVSTDPAGVQRSTWSGCKDGVRVELVRLANLGHEWPKTSSYDGLNELLKFFELQ